MKAMTHKDTRLRGRSALATVGALALTTLAHTAACGNDGLVGDLSDGATLDAEPSETPDAEPWGNLVDRVVGFGRNTTGGLGGDTCWVSNLDDAGGGSLRACAEAVGSKWIRFNASGTIRLDSMITVRSNKTIDGRGADITITNYGLRIHDSFGPVSNIIVTNLNFRDIGGANSTNTDDVNDRDAIQVRWGSTNIWIDHIYTNNIEDEHIEIGNASTDITLSWNHLQHTTEGWGYGVIIGLASTHTADVAMRITLHHNFFDELNERGPHLRFGKAHIFNNYSYDWKHRAGTSVMSGEMSSENNIFEAVTSQEIYVTLSNPWSPERGFLRSAGDWITGGGYFPGGENGRDSVFHAADYYDYTLDNADAALRDEIREGAGWQNVP